MNNTIDIQVNPHNPAQYLACCGIFEIAARFDLAATSRWDISTNPTLRIESEVAESDLVSSIIETCTRQDHWKERDVNSTENVVRIDVEFKIQTQDQVIELDWWYETLSQQSLSNKGMKEGEKIDAKSAWKMYAGRLTAEDIIKELDEAKRGMIEACREISEASVISSLGDLLTKQIGMTRRFGFDPRSSRTSLDVGFSYDALDEPTPTYPFTEMLAVIGVQSFFPPRTAPSRQLDSTRGFVKEPKGIFFDYCLWLESLPIALARVCAVGAVAQPESSLIPLRSKRIKERGEYSNLTISNLTTLTR